MWLAPVEVLAWEAAAGSPEPVGVVGVVVWEAAAAPRAEPVEPPAPTMSAARETRSCRNALRARPRSARMTPIAAAPPGTATVSKEPRASADCAEARGEPAGRAPTMNARQEPRWHLPARPVPRPCATMTRIVAARAGTATASRGPRACAARAAGQGVAAEHAPTTSARQGPRSHRRAPRAPRPCAATIPIAAQRAGTIRALRQHNPCVAPAAGREVGAEPGATRGVGERAAGVGRAAEARTRATALAPPTDTFAAALRGRRSARPDTALPTRVRASRARVTGQSGTSPSCSCQPPGT